MDTLRSHCNRWAAAWWWAGRFAPQPLWVFLVGSLAWLGWRFRVYWLTSLRIVGLAGYWALRLTATLVGLALMAVVPRARPR